MRNLPREMLGAFYEVEPLFKSGYFREEKEWRVILQHDVGASKHFDIRRDNLVPFMRIPIGEIIKKIRLGPLCRASHRM